MTGIAPPPSLARPDHGNFVPVTTKFQSGDVAFANTAGVWTAVDVNGSNDAKPTDLVFPGARADDWVWLGINGVVGNGAGILYLDFFSIVDGAKVHQLAPSGGTDDGVGAWITPSAQFGYKAGLMPYQLLAGDIDDGIARFRLHYIATNTKSLEAAATDWPFVLMGMGPFR